MIEMSFSASLLLFIISVVVSVILFFLLKIRIGKGIIGFIAEDCVGWRKAGPALQGLARRPDKGP
jgi:hypothetical protein